MPPPVVPYRSAGSHRRMIQQRMTSVGNRALGHMPHIPARALGALSCGCGGGCSHGLGGGGPAVAPGPGALTADPWGFPYVPYEAAKRLGLGALGTSVLASQVAQGAIGKAAGYGAGIAAGAALSAVGAGAAAGSVVPIVGTVVGAVVGLLSSKLFGHANYAQIAQDVATRLKYAEAYKQIAGLYPGRLMGVDDLKQVWKGLVHEDTFPKNWGGGTCNVNGCIAAGAAGAGNVCNNCGGNEGWVDDLFSGQLANPVQGFSGAIKQANGQGMSNPVQIADSVLIPAWSGPDPNKFNIKWASPSNSTNPSLVRQLMIDSLDAVEYNQNKSLPIFYGTDPNAAPASAPAPVVQAPAPVAAPPVTPAGGINTQLIPSAPATIQCTAPLVWNGTQCVLPTSSQSTAPAPPAAAPSAAPPSVPSSYTQVGADANGHPVFANPQGVLYQWNGTAFQQFTGQLASGSSVAAQVQAAIQAALAQGYTPAQAAQAAVAQQQAAGVQVPPQIIAQAPDQAAATAAAPATASTGGGFLTGNTGLIAIGLAVIGFGLATAHPKNRNLGKRSRRRA